MGYMVIRGEEIIRNRSLNTTVKNCSSPWICAFIPDEQTSAFMTSVLSHSFHLLMQESAEHTLLPCEQRTIIDRDLCEIG